MAYNCVVCVKQVPDTKNITGDAMKEDGTVNRAALPAIFNPEDLHALEAALEVRDRFGGTVTVVTMGMPQAAEVLRASLFRGVDRAILITDRRAGGSDTLATSYILSGAVRKLEPDLVFCGRQAIDGDTAQVGPQLAEKLDMNLATYMEEFITGDDRTVTVRRSLGNGWERMRIGLPVLLTVMDTANTPRPSNVRRMMKFKKAKAPAEIERDVAAEMPEADEAARAAEVARRTETLAAKGMMIEQWGLDDFEIDFDWVGLAGSPTNVNRIQSIVLTGGEYHEFEATDDGVATLVGELIKDHTIG